MAEAHQAVAFSVKVSDDGIDWNLNLNVLAEIAKSGVKSWNKGLYRIKNRFYNGLYPSRPGNWIVVVGGVFATSIFGIDLSFGLIQKIENVLQRALSLDSPRDHILASFIYSLGLWSAGVVVRKYTLCSLFSYMDWMYEAQRKISWKTKLWMGLVTVFGGRNPTLYSYQGSLPKLILPSVEDTIDGFLLSMEPLLSEEEYSELRASALEFKKKYGRRIQFYLYLKHMWSSNYVSDWWEELVYLSSRSSLMINSNYYGTDCIMLRHEWQQAARAANIVCATVQFMRKLNNEDMEPIVILGKVPLCSRQYERMFCTTRIPRDTTSPNSKYRADTLMHLPDSRYIVVLCRGNFYKVYFMKSEKYLDPVDMEKLFQEILDNSVCPQDNSKYLATLTSSERNRWAINRNTHFRYGVNKESLNTIERAAFVLILEDVNHNYDPDDDSAFDAMGKNLLHGDGSTRWFDKSVNLVVYKNGRIGLNAEHSWADAPVVAHFFETVLLDDILSPKYGYTPDGHCRGISKANLPKPQKLQWNISNELSKEIVSVLDVSKQQIEELDLTVACFLDFGRGFMKSVGVSPDAFIQMALQLTYFRESGEFALTYEASMTRIFREGRTETVRSCTNHSCEFVRSMQNSNETNENKVKLFKRACDYHQKQYRDAMTGKGVDRHIFCMYVISKYLKIESEFLTKAISVPWKLSTSQTPHTQTKKIDLTKYPNFISAGGGFGPVASDGYGVSYIMAGENYVFFHISCTKSCPTTDARKFRDTLWTSLLDIQSLFACPDAKGDA